MSVATTYAVTGFELADSAPFATPDMVLTDPATTWIPVAVPGDVHEALIAAGRLPHPYRDRDAEAARWVEERSWWYRTTVRLPARRPGDRLRLNLHGVDTVATVWVDGVERARSANMFRPVVVDLTDADADTAVLVVRFDPPLAGLAAVPPSPMLARFGGAPIARRRKAPYGWGWDFAPRLPSVGLWQPVELVHDSGVALAGAAFRTRDLDLVHGAATADVTVEADQQSAAGLAVRVSLVAPGGDVTDATAELAAGQDRVRISLALSRVRPWWTHDLGMPDRYQLTTELLRDEVVLDSRTEHVGIRTVELDRTPDPLGGRLFRFLLNGRPTYARGACVVPPSMFPGAVPATTHRALVEQAVAANMTMLRIWGGGTYGDDAFYDAADELGLLVWQDFAFACMDYPTDEPRFDDEIAAEAGYQVRRLRNRPSLAIWAGNNEVQVLHEVVAGSLTAGDWGRRYFHETLPAAVAEHSPGIPYWPSSPWGESDPWGSNGVCDGDRHAWQVWHGFDGGLPSPGEYADRGEAMHFSRYAKDTGKFVSEFGIIAAPDRHTLAEWIEPEALTLHSPTFDTHIKDSPVDKAEILLAAESGLPTDLGSYVDLTQAVQAEGLKFGIEHYRRRQPHNSGALVWQFNDPWPGVSWSLVDYAMRPKAAYHAVRRAFAPVLASFARDGHGGLTLWVTNSKHVTVSTELAVEVRTLGGDVVLRADVPVTAEPGSSASVWHVDGLGPSPNQVAWVSSADGAIPANRLLFGRIRDIDWPKSTVDAQFTPTGDTTGVVRLTAAGPSFLTHVECDDPGARFDDNHLDLRDGDTALITVTGLTNPATAAFTAQPFRTEGTV